MKDDIRKEFLDDFLGWRNRKPTGEERYWHWCQNWDGLPVDSQCVEFEVCDCDCRSTDEY